MKDEEHHNLIIDVCIPPFLFIIFTPILFLFSVQNLLFSSYAVSLTVTYIYIFPTVDFFNECWINSLYLLDGLQLCKALQSLERYWEALEIINLTRKLVYKKLPVEKKEELQSIAARNSLTSKIDDHLLHQSFGPGVGGRVVFWYYFLKSKEKNGKIVPSICYFTGHSS